MTEYPGPDTDIGKRRMAQDAAFIGDPSRWPMTGLCRLKEQPWVKANGRRFGAITRLDVRNGDWLVLVDGTDDFEEFDSLDELVRVWSVD